MSKVDDILQQCVLSDDSKDLIINLWKLLKFLINAYVLWMHFVIFLNLMNYHKVKTVRCCQFGWKTLKSEWYNLLVLKCLFYMDAETLYGGKCLIQHSSLKIESVNNTIPHIFLIYRIILNGHGSETMH